MTEDGKLVILPSSSFSTSNIHQKEVTLQDMIIEQEKEFDAKHKKKRKFNEEEEEVGAHDDLNRENSNDNRKTKISKVERNNSEQKHTGKEYKAIKAKGDVKKAGRLDPYAYVPLNPKFLNKRQKVKAKRQFDNIIHGAKKGSLSLHTKSSKKHKSNK